MFRNKLLIRFHSPFPSFLHRKLTLSPPSPTPISLHALCWNLSRKLRIACVPQSEDIYIVYQRSQSEFAKEAVEAIAEAFPVAHASVEEEVKSGLLIAEALNCGLRSVFLEEGGWSCLGSCYIVRSKFGSEEEKAHIDALHVTVQADNDDGFVFVVSPEVAHFSRHKIPGLLSSNMEQKFECSEEVMVDGQCHATSCCVLPSLCEGHVIGLRKFLPAGENFDSAKELLSFKHGLLLSSDYFMKVQFTHGDLTHAKWFPSALVLQRGGLTPAPQSIRTFKANSILESFVKVVEVWNFFGGGPLKIKSACRLDTGLEILGWRKASSNTQSLIVADYKVPTLSSPVHENISIFNTLLSAHDFRTPKPALEVLVKESAESIQIQSSSISSCKGSLRDKITEKTVSEKVSTRFRPLFMDRIRSAKSTRPGHMNLTNTQTGNSELDAYIASIGCKL